MPNYKHSLIVQGLLSLAMMSMCLDWNEYGDAFYALSTSSKNKSMALAHCESEGAVLADVVNFGIHKFLNTLMSASHNYWVGAKRSSDDTFYWPYNGMQVENASWYSGEPTLGASERSLRYMFSVDRNEFLFRDREDHLEFLYICQRWMKYGVSLENTKRDILETKIFKKGRKCGRGQKGCRRDSPKISQKGCGDANIGNECSATHSSTFSNIDTPVNASNYDHRIQMTVASVIHCARICRETTSCTLIGYVNSSLTCNIFSFAENPPAPSSVNGQVMYLLQRL